MTISNQIETPPIALTASSANLSAVQKPDAGAVFFLLVSASYLIFVAISDSLKILNERLQLLQSDLQKAIKIQGYMTNTLSTKQGVTNQETVILGGPDTDGGAANRANEIRDFIIYIKMDPKPIPVAPPAPKLSLTYANNISYSINSYVDLTRQTAQTESAKASSVQTSANAALELATSVLKTLTTALVSIASNTPR